MARIALVMIWLGACVALFLDLSAWYWVAWLWTWCLIAEASERFRSSRNLIAAAALYVTDAVSNAIRVLGNVTKTLADLGRR